MNTRNVYGYPMQAFYADPLKILKKAGIRLLLIFFLVALISFTYFHYRSFLEYTLGIGFPLLLFALFIMHPSFLFCLKTLFISKPIITIDEDGIELYGYDKVQWSKFQDAHIESWHVFKVLEIKVLVPNKYKLLQIANADNISEGYRSITVKVDDVLTTSVQKIFDTLVTYVKKEYAIPEELEATLTKDIEDEIKGKTVTLFYSSEQLVKTIGISFGVAILCAIGSWYSVDWGLEVSYFYASRGMPLYLFLLLVGSIALYAGFKYLFTYLKHSAKPSIIIDEQGVKFLPSKCIKWNDISSIERVNQDDSVTLILKNKPAFFNYVTLDKLTISSEELAKILEKYRRVYTKSSKGQP